MNILIIEDEIHCFNALNRKIQALYPDAKIDGPITSVAQMREEIIGIASDYDIIMIDIHLEDGLSFDALRNVEIQSSIIYTTAYDEYALEAFRTQGLSYLLKPIGMSELATAIERAMQMRRGAIDTESLQLTSLPAERIYRERFLIPGYDGECLLTVSEISHVVVEDNRVMAYLRSGNSMRMPFESLDEVESLLNPDTFFRVNRQYLVHIKSIRKITNSLRQNKILHLVDYPNERINVSREKFVKLKCWIEK